MVDQAQEQEHLSCAAVIWLTGGDPQQRHRARNACSDDHDVRVYDEIRGCIPRHILGIMHGIKVWCPYHKQAAGQGQGLAQGRAVWTRQDPHRRVHTA